MNISFSHLSSIASETSFLFKERLLPSLTDQQKKVVLVVSVIFSLLAATCFVISRIRFKAKTLLEGDAGKEIRVPVG